MDRESRRRSDAHLLSLPAAPLIEIWMWRSRTRRPAHYWSAEVQERVAHAYLGSGARVVHRCPSCGAADHGAPATEPSGITLSVTHSPAYLMLTVGAAGRTAGVDVEQLPLRAWSLRTEQRVLAPHEADALRRCAQAARCRGVIWTRKEAILKATGGRLAHIGAIDSNWHQGSTVPGPTHVLRTFVLADAVWSIAVPDTRHLRLRPRHEIEVSGMQRVSSAGRALARCPSR